MLWDYFECPWRSSSLSGAWYPVDEESQCCLGETASYSEQLGFGAVVGDEIWDQQSRVRIQLGPLTLEQYLDFLPGQRGASPVACAHAVSIAAASIDMEVQLILSGTKCPRCELTATRWRGPQLGWTTLDEIGGSSRATRRNGFGIVGCRRKPIWRIL